MKRLLILATLVAWGPIAFAELPPLIPRDVLFSAAEFLTPSVSPDGKRIAWLAPDDNHVQQIWMRPLDGGDDAKQLSHEKKRPIYEYARADVGLESGLGNLPRRSDNPKVPGSLTAKVERERPRMRLPSWRPLCSSSRLGCQAPPSSA